MRAYGIYVQNGDGKNRHHLMMLVQGMAEAEAQKAELEKRNPKIHYVIIREH